MIQLTSSHTQYFFINRSTLDEALSLTQTGNYEIHTQMAAILCWLGEGDAAKGHVEQALNLAKPGIEVWYHIHACI